MQLKVSLVVTNLEHCVYNINFVDVPIGVSIGDIENSRATSSDKSYAIESKFGRCFSTAVCLFEGGERISQLQLACWKISGTSCSSVSSKIDFFNYDISKRAFTEKCVFMMFTRQRTRHVKVFTSDAQVHWRPQVGNKGHLPLWKLRLRTKNF